MTVEIHPLALFALCLVAIGVGVAGTILFWGRDMDNIRFTTTHGENHE